MSEIAERTESVKSGGETMTFPGFVKVCATRWKWFVLSLAVCLGLGILYIMRQEPVFQRSEQLLIKNQQSNGSISGMSAFSSLGLFSSNSNVQNELIAITSPALMAEVIERMKLTMDYVGQSGLHPQTLYGTGLPIEVTIPEIGKREAASMECVLHPDGTVVLNRFKKYSGGEKEKFNEEISTKVGATVKTPIGMVGIAVNPAYQGAGLKKPLKMVISKSDFQSTIERYTGEVTGTLVDDFADVIELTIKDTNVERAEAILNEIVVVYNKDYLDDKNQVAKATSAFIDERLGIIERELGEVDTEIADYSTSIGTYSLSEQGKAMAEKGYEYEAKIVELSTQLQLARYIKDYLASPGNRYNILPVNTATQNPEVESQVNQYNEMLIQRNSLAANSSDQNPIVKDYDSQLEGMRKAIDMGLANHIRLLDESLKSSQKEYDKAMGVVRSTSTQTLPLLSGVRQQKVKENLYLYLLEKKEENELSKKFTADNTRVITPPMGSYRPVSPKKMIILGFSFLMGLALPMLMVYFYVIGDTKVRSRKDLDSLQLPFAGEIPQIGKSRLPSKGAVNKRLNLKDEKPPLGVVEEGKRDVVNEAFRVVRSNIEFMTRGSDSPEALMITSFNPGSGKSFIAYNLGLSFALKKKRVLLIDCDLRHGSSSMHVGMPHRGLTDYLSGAVNGWKDLTVESPMNSEMEILPIGKVPPNPAELLENGRLSDLVKEAKKEYDYVLLDCPPVNIVVDTQIVGRLADATLFVVRAGLLEKGALAELAMLYGENKFKRISVVLNGTDESHSRYYSYGNYQHLEG